MPGIGGGGGGDVVGAPLGGIGGGGGGDALGASVGMGGGGGGGGAEASGAGTGGGGGAEASGVGGAGELTLCGEAARSSVADSGRGGAIVPKRIDASWAALAPPGLSSSSSESSSSLSEPQSSSSGRFLDTGADGAAGAAPCVMRWKGLVDSVGAAAGTGTAAGAAAAGAELLGVDDASED